MSIKPSRWSACSAPSAGLSPGICIGVTGISDTTGIFTLAALCSVALALYSLTLPHTPAPAKGMPVQFRDLLCADAFALLKTRHS